MVGDVLEQNDPLHAGQAALGRAAWQDARDLFQAALAKDETPEALEGLGAAAWWLGDGATVFDARERAYRLYRDRQNDRGAARVATGLAIDHCTFRGEVVVAGGWVQRAERLLQTAAKSMTVHANGLPQLDAVEERLDCLRRNGRLIYSRPMASAELVVGRAASHDPASGVVRSVARRPVVK